MESRIRAALLAALLASTRCFASHHLHEIPHLLSQNGGNQAIVEMTSTLKNDTLYWGTYRPGVYFGVRNRSPTEDGGLLTGLMWFGFADGERTPIRHKCDLDDSIRFGWMRHDGRSYGEQVITDTREGVRLRTYFLNDAKMGGGWSARVQVQHIDESRKAKPMSLLFYVGLNTADSGYIDVLRGTRKGISKTVTLKGDSEELGRFSINISATRARTFPNAPRDGQLTDLASFQFFSREVPSNQVWNTEGTASVSSTGDEFFRFRRAESNGDSWARNELLGSSQKRRQFRSSEQA